MFILFTLTAVSSDGDISDNNSKSDIFIVLFY